MLLIVNISPFFQILNDIWVTLTEKTKQKKSKTTPQKNTKNLLCHHGAEKVLFHCCSVIHYPFVFGRCSRSIFVKVEFTPVSTKKENKGRSKSSTDRKSNNNTESMVKISFDHYSCVPNKSAALLLIQENFSFQLTLDRSNRFIKSHIPANMFICNNRFKTL